MYEFTSAVTLFSSPCCTNWASHQIPRSYIFKLKFCSLVKKMFPLIYKLNTRKRNDQKWSQKGSSHNFPSTRGFTHWQISSAQHVNTYNLLWPVKDRHWCWMSAFSICWSFHRSMHWLIKFLFQTQRAVFYWRVKIDPRNTPSLSDFTLFY